MKVDVMDLGITDDGVHLREFAVVIAAQNHNPTIVNPDFLKLNGIAEADWQLAQAPVCVEPLAQVQYTNGISVLAEPQKIVFAQAGETLSQENIIIVKMARQYIEAVPHVDYTGIGINPKGDVGFRTEEGPRRYIMERLIARGPWQEYGEAPVKGSATFIFQLGKARVFLAVQEATRRNPKGTGAPVIVFSGNFHYDLAAVPRNGMLETLTGVLDDWRTCWTEYTNLVNSVFCKEL
ncbi:MAG: hypothetical protein V1792_18860 [Pseudomonadota bacterium]